MKVSAWKMLGVVLALAGPAEILNAQPVPGGPSGAMPQVALEVGTVEMTRQTIPLVVTAPGRAVAFQQVELRPRVGGVIEEILYTPGQLLGIGDPLFKIDDSSYIAAVATARADVATAQANLDFMQLAYDRATQLEGRGTSTAEVDSARANLAQAKAALDAAKAALDYAQTELSWTTVRSPIAGRADVAAVSVGDLVTAGQSDHLTTIVQSDPIYVDMAEASARILSVRKGFAEGTLEPAGAIKATLRLENGDVLRGVGQLVTPGNTVSQTTGTVTIRFQFDNPEHVVIPGMFVQGEVTLGTMQAFLVPQRAATRRNSGKLTAYVVGQDGTAQQVVLEDEGSYQNAWIVRDGLHEGDRLIVDGLSAIRPGQEVTPIAATIDENGNVRDADTTVGEE